MVVLVVIMVLMEIMVVMVVVMVVVIVSLLMVVMMVMDYGRIVDGGGGIVGEGADGGGVSCSDVLRLLSGHQTVIFAVQAVLRMLMRAGLSGDYYFFV
ncbi:hypothetical protein DPMN_140204 [Dreissena polymorpha]|uniref:Uncharacterized protein n=1 Tax=Dreissena polymorpha TaxID=45954 RepID=A0A9D4JK62_DREPO|nr:hypothetical protein DPMN_140204 [Dreissena polymorpha]